MRSLFTFLLFMWLCFFWAATIQAKPPQAPNPPQAPTLIPPCGCGCMETGMCKCKNCCERTADPAWRPQQSFSQGFTQAAPVTADRWVQVCTPEGCRLVKIPSPQFQTPAGSGCQDGSCGNQSYGSFGQPSFSSGSCGTTSGPSVGSSGRWYPGKNLGRPAPRRFR